MKRGTNTSRWQTETLLFTVLGAVQKTCCIANETCTFQQLPKCDGTHLATLNFVEKKGKREIFATPRYEASQLGGRLKLLPPFDHSAFLV